MYCPGNIIAKVRHLKLASHAPTSCIKFDGMELRTSVLSTWLVITPASHFLAFLLLMVEYVS